MRKAFYTKLRFSGCAGLTSVVIPDSVTKIVGDAFANCFYIILLFQIGMTAVWSCVTFTFFHLWIAMAQVLCYVILE